MKKTKICSVCETGIRMLKLDKYEPICPYIEGHNGKRCGHFVRLKKSDIFHSLFKMKKSMR